MRSAQTEAWRTDDGCIPLQLVINEISSSAPQALQAVKLLAQYHGKKLPTVCVPAPARSCVFRCTPRHTQDDTVWLRRLITMHVMLQEKVLATLAEWQADPATASNVTVLLVAGLIYTNLENYVEALRAVHGGHNLEMCADLVFHADITSSYIQDFNATYTKDLPSTGG